jgi:membrane associated rhomboid family serine protease
MLLIPVTSVIHRKNFPYATLAFILVNAVIYFGIQSGDLAGVRRADAYYFESGLAVMELSRYLDHLHPENAPHRIDPDNHRRIRRLRRRMDRDAPFVRRLMAGRVITEADPNHGTWRAARNRYETLLSEIVSVKYGFRPNFGNPAGPFTYMFLHGSTGHLVGNMIFLWLVGCIVETGTSRRMLFAAYGIGGLAAAGLFWMLNRDSVIPLVGASGAISGIMGLFTVLYGLRKVNIFFTTGFFFTYMKIPALVLLPVWIGAELWPLVFGEASLTAYEAHLGGLVGGALFGLANRRFPDILRAIPAEDPAEIEDARKARIEAGLFHLERVNLPAARRIFAELAAADPTDETALLYLFHIDKNNPDDPRFHEITRRLIRLHLDTTKDVDTALRVYREYLHNARYNKLPASLHLRMCGLLAAAGKPEPARRILTVLLKQTPSLPGIAAGFLKLADAYDLRGEPKKAAACRKTISHRFPGSKEADIANRRLF